MDITPLVPKGQQIIQSYAGGRFRISGQVYGGPVCVFVDETVGWPVDKAVNDLGIEDMDSLVKKKDEVDVLLIGCGKAPAPLPPGLRASLKAHGITAETMDTGAACRTWNVLIADGRRVAAVLLPF